MWEPKVEEHRPVRFDEEQKDFALQTFLCSCSSVKGKRRFLSHPRCSKMQPFFFSDQVKNGSLSIHLIQSKDFCLHSDTSHYLRYHSILHRGINVCGNEARDIIQMRLCNRLFIMPKLLPCMLLIIPFFSRDPSQVNSYTSSLSFMHTHCLHFIFTEIHK